MRIVMRLGLACGLLLLALTASAAPRAKDEAKAEAKNQPSATSTRENYRARLNENVVTIMAGSASGTDQSRNRLLATKTAATTRT